MDNIELTDFLTNNDESTVSDYSKNLIENLKDLNVKEEKHNLWILIMVFLYLILSNSKIESFSVGPISINDISLIGKILPLIFTYILFSLRTISSQKRETIEALKFLSEKQFNLIPENVVEKQIGIKTIVRLYLPYSFTNSIMKLFKKKPNVIEALFGFPLLLPVLAIASAPYVIIVLMLIDLWQNSMNDFLGKSCFWLTIWLTLIMLFYMIKNVANIVEESKTTSPNRL